MADLVGLLRGAVDSDDAGHQPAPVGRRSAGVLLLFDTHTPGLPLLFIKRTAHLRHHAGQIGFPGGGSELSDPSIVATALREAEEEAGVPREAVEVIGMLPPFLTATSDRWLTPVVALQDREIRLRPDPYEVARLFHIDLAELIAAPHRVQTWTHEGAVREVHFYDVGGEVVWGVTAAIVAELIARLEARAPGLSGSGGAR